MSREDPTSDMQLLTMSFSSSSDFLASIVSDNLSSSALLLTISFLCIDRVISFRRYKLSITIAIIVGTTSIAEAMAMSLGLLFAGIPSPFNKSIVNISDRPHSKTCCYRHCRASAFENTSRPLTCLAPYIFEWVPQHHFCRQTAVEQLPKSFDLCETAPDEYLF